MPSTALRLRTTSSDGRFVIVKNVTELIRLLKPRADIDLGQTASQ